MAKIGPFGVLCLLWSFFILIILLILSIWLLLGSDYNPSCTTFNRLQCNIWTLKDSSCYWCNTTDICVNFNCNSTETDPACDNFDAALLDCAPTKRERQRITGAVGIPISVLGLVGLVSFTLYLHLWQGEGGFAQMIAIVLYISGGAVWSVVIISDLYQAYLSGNSSGICTLIVLGFVYIADGSKAFKYASKADLHFYQLILMMFTIVAVIIFEILFLFLKHLESAWIALMTIAIASLETGLSFQEIQGHRIVLRITIWVLYGSIVVTGFVTVIMAISYEHVGELLHFMVAAVALAEQLILFISKPENRPRSYAGLKETFGVDEEMENMPSEENENLG